MFGGFGLELSAEDLATVGRYAERAYPEEVCGLGLGPALGRQQVPSPGRYAERAYPEEACGLGLGRQQVPSPGRYAERAYPQEARGLGPSAGPMRDRSVRRWVQLKNVASAPRSAFRFDDLEHLRVLQQADREGLRARVLFHSHPDRPPLMSRTDRARAVYAGVECMPGVLHLILSVRDGRWVTWGLHRYGPERGDFESQVGARPVGLATLGGLRVP